MKTKSTLIVAFALAAMAAVPATAQDGETTQGTSGYLTETNAPEIAGEAQ